MVAALLPLMAGFLFAGGNPRMPRDAANYGQVPFENSCTKPVQQTLQQAIALLHSFEFGEAISAFHAVESRDPFSSTAILGGSGHDRQPTAMGQPVSPSGYAAREKDREGSHRRGDWRCNCTGCGAQDGIWNYDEMPKLSSALLGVHLQCARKDP